MSYRARHEKFPELLHCLVMQDKPDYELAKELLKRSINTTGAIQANRKGLPVELGKKNKKLVELASYQLQR